MEKMKEVSEPLHPDFQKILTQFQKRYGKTLGSQYFHAWVNKLGLDDTKPYGWQEKFSWIQPFQIIRTDKSTLFYKVEAAFPLSSMNMNVYTEYELERAARTLIGKPVNMNHESHVLRGVTIQDAEYEGGAVEVLLRVLFNAGHGLGLKIQKMIATGEIVHVSIEASCLRGITQTPDGSVCKGLNFTGLALLTKDALPGIPLTRVLPVESLVEGVEIIEKEERKIENVEKGVTENSGLKAVEEKKEKKATKGKTVAEKVAKLKFDVSELKRLNKELTEKQDAAESLLEAKDKRMSEADANTARLERDIEVLNGKLEQLREIHTETVKENSSLTADHAGLKKRFEQLVKEHDSLVKCSEETSALLDQEREAHYESADENLRLTKQLTERNNEVLSLKTKVSGLTEKVKKNRRHARIIVKA